MRAKRKAIYAYCKDCGALFDESTCPYWHWSKAAWLHENGTGHKTSRFYVPLGPHEWNILAGEKP